MKGTAIAFALGLAVPAGAQTVPPAPADPIALHIVAMPPVPDDPVAELIAVHRDRTSAVHRCPTTPSDEIVVCGNRAERNARQRLPLPEEAISEDDGRIVRGELPRASSVPIKVGSCGVVREGRPCVSDTNNILTATGFLMKLFTRLIDPDADVAPPTDIPDRFRGAGR